MKTAISIPDNTFDLAEHFANSTGMSRSELYTKAVLEYLENHKDKDVTKALNMVYAHEDSSLDNELQSMQIKSLPIEDW